LLARKTELMREALAQRGAGRRGLDVGCGQGAYLARMRELGFDVAGVDPSSAQVRAAARTVGDPALVGNASVLDLPAENGSYDFVYVINVLHHLATVDEQQRAFHELFRVLKAGGLLFLH